jgi:HAD superfamily hydrolase (TIGR01509 family)
MQENPIFTPPTKKYSGYIFDCDGTLAHSMPLHYAAWKRVALENGIDMTEDYFYSLAGVPTPKIVEFMNDRWNKTMDPESVAHRKEQFYLESIDTMQAIEPVARFAKEVAKTSKISIASGGFLPVVKQTLAVIGFEDFFSIIVTSEQVTRGKPFPDIFLEAAQRMDVPPSECLVLEDGIAGIEAAKAAGMDWTLVQRPVKKS